MRFIIFFVVWSSILGLGYWYVGKRVINAAQFTHRRRAVAWAVVGLFFIVPQAPFLFFLNRIQTTWVDELSLIGYLVLGFFTLVVTFFVLRDLVLLITRGVDSLHVRIRSDKSPSPTFSKDRRRFLVHASNIGIVAASAAMTGYGLMQAKRTPALETVEIPLADLPEEFDGFRILQFSDLHVGPTIKRDYVEHVAQQIHAVNADMIAFTGDLVDGSVSWLADDVAPLKELHAPFGKFFVTGNHEYYSGVEEWVVEAGRLGFDVLNNEHRIITKGNARVILAGVTDYGGEDFLRSHRSDPAAAIATAPQHVKKILLAHQPRSIFAAEQCGYDVQLSGHTHGGQYFPGNYLARLNQPYITGLHRRKNTSVYVNRGVGYWGPPLRLGAPPELTLVTLKKA
ncbi:MAG: metallophosphoesterase [Ignavibacteriae bacterium]|nr:metallophosphoesterase [Ignavibacteriota bacterium]